MKYELRIMNKIFKKFKKRLFVIRYSSSVRNVGFSLIGILISVFVASVGMMAIFSLSTMSLKTSDVGQKRLIASGLAQEGIEIVRDIRMSHSSWEDWVWYSTTIPMIPVGDSRVYCVQYDSTILLPCSSPESPLRLNESNMLYQYSSGSNSPFYRKVTLTRQNINQVKVFVEIKWKLNQAGEWHYLIAEDRLWNWR